jgi:hypothetical protein
MAKTRRQPYTYTLAAGEEKRIPFVGDFVRLISWTGTTGELYIGLGDGISPAQMDVGEEWHGEGYDYVTVRNNGAVQGIVKFVVGNGQSANYAFSTSNTINVNQGATSITSGVAAPTTVAGAITIAAQTNQREIELYNSGSYPVWVGGSTVDSATKTGTYIDVGATKILSTAAKLYLHSVGGVGSISFNRHIGA